MTVHRIILQTFTLGLVAFGLLVVPAANVLGQFPLSAQIGLLQDDEFCGSGCEHDLQFFSPVDFDFDCQPLRKSCGWFFTYDKLSWAMTGDRAVIGDENIQVFSEIIVPDDLARPGVDPNLTTSPLTAADLQYRIVNGLQDVPPMADFAWGERYEFGSFNGNMGWSVSIIDGPEVHASRVYGAPDRNFFGEQQAFGFGSIHVNFALENPTLLLGFRDYWGSGVETDSFVAPTETTSGPGNFDFPLNNADGIADDLDGDGAEGAVIIFGIDMDGNPIAIGIGVDLDDLHMFNVTFNQLAVRNSTETQGVEIMQNHRLDNSHKMKKNQNRVLHAGYGVRFLRLRDQFQVNGPSPLLGTFELNAETANQLVGPQIRAQYLQHQGRWTWNFDGRCMLAYNITDLDLAGSYGLDDDPSGVFPDNAGLAPGALNRPISLQPNTYAYGRRANEFSPVIELRTDLSYQITSSVAARLGYTAIFVDNISRAAAVTEYTLPNMGIGRTGEQDIFINGANFGFDVVY